jgi:hypothetical protein
MTTQQIVIIAAALSVAVIAFLGALATWRALGNAGRGLRNASDSLNATALTLPTRLKGVGFRLAEIDAQADHALWLLGNVDDRIDRATADLRAKRVASDRLHVRLIEGRLTIARLKQLVRLMIRLGELRRVVL